MQSEHPEVSSQISTHVAEDNATSSQHGYSNEDFASPTLSPREELSGYSRSGSEWSLSPSSGQSPLDSPRMRLNSIDFPLYDDDALIDDGHAQTRKHEDEAIFKVLKSGSKRRLSDHSPLLEFPEELLFQVLSHLNATDLLTIKLVSKRFYNVVNSPHAWISAFSRYFPGPESLKLTGDVKTSEQPLSDLRTEKREFTRLSGATSWTSEYLLRTKLLRCLARGKPSLPFAAPSQGKPGKGYATFTFSSRLGFGADRLSAKFGGVLDKRSPHFIHGLSTRGSVTTSDKRGKFDGWGIHDHFQFRSFEVSHPGSALWGLGNGELVGVPNAMDVSATHGMVCGEGTPGGNVYFISTAEKHGRYLSPFLGIAYHHFGVPKISQDDQCVSSVWVAKSLAVPRMTKGLVGILSGSSSGVVSAFSFGQSGFQQHRFDRGELTARWLLSPGVPIIALVADDLYSEERHATGRVWAVALNALGEVFVLKSIPALSSVPKRHESQVDRFHELRAWQTGLGAAWHLVKPSTRTERSLDVSKPDVLPYLPFSVQEEMTTSAQESVNQIPELESWLLKRPHEFRSMFDGWDMQRRLHMDFGGDDGKVAGENVLVFECGITENSPASVTRYARCALAVNTVPTHDNLNDSTRAATQPVPRFDEPSWSFDSAQVSTATEEKHGADSKPAENIFKFEWRRSRFSFGRYRNVQITTTAIDESMFGSTTCTEDMTQSQKRNNPSAPSTPVDEHNSFKFPGQRARLLAVGTAAGTIFVWNARGPVSAASGVQNVITPLRIIHTDSPAVSSLALTALYLVHGGSEGLVQAWDLLASTLEPVRTISSRTTLNARRRAVIVAQQNPSPQSFDVSFYAASAICLDPDPTILRGIVAIGTLLRYWSYSSADATDGVSKSQKRRMNRAAKGFSASPGESYSSFRRLGLKDLVNEEMASREMEQKDKRAEERERKRVAGRFGLDLLGQDASDEDLLAYAKLLSEEEHNNQVARGSEDRLDKNATQDEVEAHKSALSAEDFERWKFASWEERFEIPTADSRTRTPTSTRKVDSSADDIAKAIELSLKDAPRTPSPPPSAESSAADEPDDDIAKAIRLSLEEQQQSQSPKTPSLDSSGGSADEDMAKAIELSLHENSSSPWQTPVTGGTSQPSDRLRTNSHDDFPALSSSPASSPAPSRARGRGKGKRRA